MSWQSSVINYGQQRPLHPEVRLLLQTLFSSLRSSVEDTPTVLGPLKPDTSAQQGKQEGKKAPASPLVYGFSHWAR